MDGLERERNNNRIQWLDILKGILVFYVIISHSYPKQIYREFYTPFFLPMFFFVSGYTFSPKRDFKTFLKSKFLRLIRPFLILGMIRVVIRFLLEGGSLMRQLLWFLLQISGRCDEMWFVSCMFTCSLLFYGVLILRERMDCKYKDAVLFGVSIIIMTLGFIDMCVWKFKFMWEIEIACMMIFYMALGYLYRVYQSVIERKMEKPLWISVFTTIYLLCVFLIQNDVDIHEERFTYPTVFLMMSLLVMPPLVYLTKFMCRNRENRVLCFLGKHTLFYYAFSGIGRMIFFTIFAYTDTSYIQPVICAGFSVILLAWPAWFAGSYLPWMVGK